MYDVKKYLPLEDIYKIVEETIQPENFKRITEKIYELDNSSSYELDNSYDMFSALTFIAFKEGKFLYKIGYELDDSHTLVEKTLLKREPKIELTLFLKGMGTANIHISNLKKDSKGLDKKYWDKIKFNLCDLVKEFHTLKKRKLLIALKKLYDSPTFITVDELTKIMPSIIEETEIVRFGNIQYSLLTEELEALIKLRKL